MKFIMAYSGGKDCTLALDRMVRQGHEPVAVYTTVTARGINFNHFIRKEVYQAYGECFGIPVIFCTTKELHNVNDIYSSMKEAVEKYNAEAICTGDIFVDDIAAWNRKMAQRLGVEWACPLWQEPTDKLIDELLERGYRCLIKSVRTDVLEETYLARELTRKLIGEFAEKGIDICGEQGEYHSIAVDGPVFKKTLPVRLTNIIRSKEYATYDMLLDNREIICE